MKINKIMDLLKAKNIKITSQRKAIIKVLCENEMKLLCVDEILKLSKNVNPEINKTTVYRNLELLNDIGIVYQKQINSNICSYKLKCKENHHHHIICERCGRIETVDICPLNDEVIKLIESKKFRLTNHEFNLSGICEKCKNKK